MHTNSFERETSGDGTDALQKQCAELLQKIPDAPPDDSEYSRKAFVLHAHTMQVFIWNFLRHKAMFLCTPCHVYVHTGQSTCAHNCACLVSRAERCAFSCTLSHTEACTSDENFEFVCYGEEDASSLPPDPFIQEWVWSVCRCDWTRDAMCPRLPLHRHFRVIKIHLQWIIACISVLGVRAPHASCWMHALRRL